MPSKTIISSFHYDHRKRTATLIAQPDGLDITLKVYYLGTYKELRNFDHRLAPCILKFRKPELARFACSTFGGTRVGTVVFLQSTIAKYPVSWPISQEVFFRKTFESWTSLQEAVDNSRNIWTEVRTIGAESRQLKYNIIHNPRSKMPAILYDMFISDDAMFIRPKSAQEDDAIYDNPYVFTRTGLKNIGLYFPFVEGDVSNEVESYLTSPEE